MASFLACWRVAVLMVLVMMLPRKPSSGEVEENVSLVQLAY